MGLFDGPGHTARLLHYPSRPAFGWCAQCQGTFEPVGHWCVKARYPDRVTVERFCGEPCARLVYNARLVEFSLITGKKIKSGKGASR